jgi:hypothetical protein
MIKLRRRATGKQELEEQQQQRDEREVGELSDAYEHRATTLWILGKEYVG